MNIPDKKLSNITISPKPMCKELIFIKQDDNSYKPLLIRDETANGLGPWKVNI